MYTSTKQLFQRSMSMLLSLASVLSPGRFPPAPLQDTERTMRAVVIHRHGGPENLVLEDFPAPIPNPRARHVLVEVSHAGLNPVDFKMRKYNISDLAYPKPKIIGSDISGRVLSAPTDSPFAVGDRVFGMLPLLGTQYGGYATQCCIDENYLCHAPDNVSLKDLSSIPLVACTIVGALRPVIEAFNGQTAGRKCFIQAGSGGVGTFAVQYCANVLGMLVATTCSPRNADLLLSLGASEVIDYHTERIEDRIRDYDVFIDVLGYKYEDIVLDSKSHILRRSGDFPSHYVRIASSPHVLEESDPHISRDPFGVTIPEASPLRVMKGAVKQLFNMHSGIGYHFVLVKPDKLALQVAADAMKEGKIRAVIQEVIPLEEAARAHRELENGHVTGKLVLCVNESIV